MLLERAGLAPRHAVHVGDDPEADVEGARRAGVAPVWLNRYGDNWPRASQEPLAIRSLVELDVLLG